MIIFSIAFLLGQDADKASKNFWADLQQSHCWSKRLIAITENLEHK